MAFFSQSVLMSFFYLPIFPLGMVITLLGTVIAYLIEKVSIKVELNIHYINNFANFFHYTLLVQLNQHIQKT